MSTIHLVISTTAGDLEDDFPQNQPIHALKTAVMARLKLDPSKASDYILTLDGIELDDSKTLAGLQIADGSLLILERREAVKIARATG